MSFKMDRLHVWAVEVKDEPGSVAGKLAKLDEAGCDLDYVYTQRDAAKPGHGVLYVAPVTGNGPTKAAKDAGMHAVADPVVMRVEGDNVAGLAHRVKHAWAAAGINLHGSMLTTVGSKFVGFVTFDTVEDANKAARILAEVGVEKAAGKK